MGMQKKLSYDPMTGVTEWFVSKDDGTFDIVMEQDITDIAEVANDDRKDRRGTGGWKGDGMHKVATMPMTVLQEFMNRGELQDQNAIKRWVNDPANAIYRSRSGRI